ncbi:MAG: MFS transporter [Chloroflexota bacterium]
METAQLPDKIGAMTPFSVLRLRHIRLLWIGQLLSAFGDLFFEIAIVWLSVQIIGSEAGFVLAAGSITRLAFGLIGGYFADIWDRQKTMIVIDLLRALSILSLPVAALLGEITLFHLAVISAIDGALSAIFEPALQSSLPQLTKNSQELQGGNALLDVTSRMARIFAPGVAGFIIGFIPIEQFFTIDALTFGISALALVAIGRNFKWKVTSDEPRPFGWQTITADLRQALRLLRENTAVYYSLFSFLAANIVWAGAMTVGLALLADGRLDVGVQGYSFLITVYGVGSVLSNLVIGSMTIKNRPRFLFAGAIIYGLGLLLIGLSGSFPMALAGAFVAALGTPMSDLMIVIMIQEEFPENQVGKIYSLRLTISSVGYSLGLLLAAYLFELTAVSTGIFWFGVVMIGIGIWGVIRFLNHSH